MRHKVEQQLMLDRFQKDIIKLTEEDRQFLVFLNMRLTSLEEDLKDEVKEMLRFGQQRAQCGAAYLCRDCVEVEWEVQFFIGEGDPAWDDEQDNMLACLTESHGANEEWGFGIADSENHNEFQHRPEHPMSDEFHCWLFHCLYHHVSLDLGDGRRSVDLDWGNILRIDRIDVDLTLLFQGGLNLRYFGK